MLAAHQGGILEPTAASLAVRVNVINGEVLPGQFPAAAGRSANAGIRGIPKDSSLLRTKSPLRILAGKQATENTAQDLFALATMVYVIGHLRDGD
jgi:hypothetical protein